VTEATSQSRPMNSLAISRGSVWGWSDERADSESNSAVLGMLASLWAIVGIHASNLEAPWKMFGLATVGLFLSYLLHFLGTGLRRKGQDKNLKG
jgi:hypothetical protein